MVELFLARCTIYVIQDVPAKNITVWLSLPYPRIRIIIGHIRIKCTLTRYLNISTPNENKGNKTPVVALLNIYYALLYDLSY